MTHPGPSAPPTLADVAARAGVSPMTASRVLSGKQRVSPERRDAVLSAVSELGFVRNENARSLRPGSASGLIGVLVTNLSNPYYAAMLEGIEAIAAAERLRILIGASHEDRAVERELLNEFAGRRTDGLIVVPASRPDSASPFDTAGIPMVFASRRRDDMQADSVVVDDIQGTRRSIEDLLHRGHRRVAFVALGGATFTTERRLEGFLLAHAQRTVTVQPSLIEKSASSVQRIVEHLFDQPDPPTALFSANNRTTVEMLRALKRVGLTRKSGPEIVAFDNFDLSDLIDMDLTVVEHDPAELGRAAMRLLLRRRSRPTAQLQHLEMTTRNYRPSNLL